MGAEIASASTMISLLRHFVVGCLLALVARAQTTYFYAGDLQPSQGQYAAWFTTVGPGHPTGGYFGGTTWSSNGDVLTMTTQNPRDFAGATSQGIWFGLGYSYNDNPAIGFSGTETGNNVTTRVALAPNSSEWGLYWYDASGQGVSVAINADGFTAYFRNPTSGADSIFVPIADMTSFHTLSTHVYQGQASVYVDGSLIGTGLALSGSNGLMVFGDGSASDVSGYGSLLVDSLSITINAGLAPIPEPAVGAEVGGVMVLLAVVVMGRKQKKKKFNRG